jgi:hypothetical protein
MGSILIWEGMQAMKGWLDYSKFKLVNAKSNKVEFGVLKVNVKLLKNM